MPAASEGGGGGGGVAEGGEGARGRRHAKLATHTWGSIGVLSFTFNSSVDGTQWVGCVDASFFSV